jgi:hypothetical protein
MRRGIANWLKVLVIVLVGTVDSLGMVQADGLYEAEVAVDGRGPDSEFAGLTAALTQVLIRLTGDANIAESKKVQALYTDPQKYVAQYGFRSASDGGLRLKAQFDQRALDAALKKTGTKFTSDQLPSVVVWLTAGQSGRQSWRFIGAEDDSGLGPELKGAAGQRRLPLVLPLLDLEDQTQIHPDDVVTSNYDKINNASLRYGTKAIVAGTMEEGQDGHYNAQLNLVLANGQTVPWSQQGAQREQVIREAMAWVSDYLVKNRLPGKPDMGELNIVVEDVSSLDGYMRALRFIRLQEQVASVAVRQVETNKVTFVVKPATSTDRLFQALREGSTLQAMSEDGLDYRLLP